MWIMRCDRCGVTFDDRLLPPEWISAMAAPYELTINFPRPGRSEYTADCIIYGRHFCGIYCLEKYLKAAFEPPEKK